MIATIRVTMFGGLSVWVDDVPVLDSAAKINKPWQVFCFLVLNRNMPSAPSRILDALWADESLSDPGNVLKNTIYALRREFKNADIDIENPILFENGGYICNPNITFEVDCEMFEKGCIEAENLSSDEKLDKISETVLLYKGELLPQLESESWLVPLALYYKKRYTEGQAQLCSILYEQKRYSELLSAATTASQVDPLEEEYYLYIFRALYSLKMFRVIIPTYHKAARIFSEELGTSLNDEIKRIYESASEQIDQIEQDIMIIKDDLREVTYDSRPISGPLYCTYDVFKYLYQMVARSSERSGSSIVIVLLTLQNEDGGTIPSKLLSGAMNQIKNNILSGLLRRSDTVARYSKSQFIVMLSIDRAGGTKSVIDRIHRKCDPFLDPSGIKLVIASTELEPLSR